MHLLLHLTAPRPTIITSAFRKQIDILRFHNPCHRHVNFSISHTLISSRMGAPVSEKKVLVVFGATGKQGGSVVKAVLSDPKTAAAYTVRAVTRDTTKPAAEELKKLGAEPVQADLNDASSVKSVTEGANAVFAVTNFWEKMSAEVELQQGKNIADASKAAGVQHLIWSSLLNVTKLSGGKLSKVAHFDAKADVEEYIRSIGVPSSFFMPGFFMSNVPGQSLNNMQGPYNIALPMPTNSPIPLFDVVGDTGKFVKGMLLNPEKVAGKRIYGATAYYTPEQILAEFQEVFPKDGPGGKAIPLPEEVFKKILGSKGMPEHIQEELLQNMQLMPQFGYYGGADLTESHSILDTPATTWKEFAKAAPAFAELK